MRILKKGTKNKFWSQEVECTGAGQYNLDDTSCGAILELSPEDVFIDNTYEQRFGTIEKTVFVCPQCNTITTFQAIGLDKSKCSKLRNY